MIMVLKNNYYKIILIFYLTKIFLQILSFKFEMDLEIFHKNNISLKGRVFFKKGRNNTKKNVYLDYNTEILKENFSCNYFGFDKIHSVLSFEIYNKTKNTSFDKLIKINNVFSR